MSPLRGTSEIPLSLLGKPTSEISHDALLETGSNNDGLYLHARESRHILGGDFRLFQSGCHLSFLRHMYEIHQ